MPESPVSTTCPACGSIADFDPTTTLLPGSQELLELFRGELNTCICSSCDQTFRIETPILYRNDDARALIYLLPDPEPDETVVDRLVDQIVESTFGSIADGQPPTVRVVTQHAHFLEKIAILQKGLDDRIVEYVKYLLFQNSDEVDDDGFELLLDFTDDSEDALTFIAFHRETLKGEYGLAFEKADYDELAQVFSESPEAADKLQTLFPGYIVSVDRLIEYASDMDDGE